MAGSRINEPGPVNIIGWAFLCSTLLVSRTNNVSTCIMEDRLFATELFNICRYIKEVIYKKQR